MKLCFTTSTLHMQAEDFTSHHRALQQRYAARRFAYREAIGLYDCYPTPSPAAEYNHG